MQGGLGAVQALGPALDLASEYLQRDLAESGYSVNIRPYTVAGKQMQNIEAILKGVNETDTLVVGAHYDSAHGTPGADDNASGSAAILEIARLSKRLGLYSDAPKSQKYPILVGLLYPSQGNFVGFVGDTGSRDLVRQATKAFRESCDFPSEGLSAPSSWPGVGWSDHWSFWKQGVPAIMVTDTALFRNPHYHRSTDTQDKLDFEKLASVVSGLSRTLVKMANKI